MDRPNLALNPTDDRFAIDANLLRQPPLLDSKLGDPILEKDVIEENFLLCHSPIFVDTKKNDK